MKLGLQNLWSCYDTITWSLDCDVIIANWTSKIRDAEHWKTAPGTAGVLCSLTGSFVGWNLIHVYLFIWFRCYAVILKHYNRTQSFSPCACFTLGRNGGSHNCPSFFVGNMYIISTNVPFFSATWGNQKKSIRSTTNLNEPIILSIRTHPATWLDSAQGLPYFFWTKPLAAICLVVKGIADPQPRILPFSPK